MPTRSAHRAVWSHPPTVLAAVVLGVLLTGCATSGRGSGLMAMDEESLEQARRAEVALATSEVWGVASGAHDVGTRLMFTFWVERGALTLTGYQAVRRDGTAGKPVDADDTRGELAEALASFSRRPRGEVRLTLRRDTSRWVVERDASTSAARPPESRPLPLNHKGIPEGTVRGAMDRMRDVLAPVAVPSGGAAWASVDVRMEDGHLVEWKLREWRATRGGKGGGTRPVAPSVSAEATHLLLLYAQAMGPRTVRLELHLSAHDGGPVAGGWVEQTRVDSALMLARE